MRSMGGGLDAPSYRWRSPRSTGTITPSRSRSSLTFIILCSFKSGHSTISRREKIHTVTLKPLAWNARNTRYRGSQDAWASTCSLTWIFNSLHNAMQSPLSVSIRIPYPYPVFVMSIHNILVRRTPRCPWQASDAPVGAFYVVMQCAPSTPNKTKEASRYSKQVARNKVRSSRKRCRL